jgi:hypothetical protein
MKKSKTQKRIEKAGWSVTQKSKSVKATWGAAKVEASTLSDLRFLTKSISKLFRLSLKTS